MWLVDCSYGGEWFIIQERRKSLVGTRLTFFLFRFVRGSRAIEEEESAVDEVNI